MTVNNRNIEILEEEKKQLEFMNGTIAELEEKKQKSRQVVRTRPLSYPRTVCSKHKKIKGDVTVYEQICHDHCHIEGVPNELINRVELQKCDAMEDGTCKVCHHSWNVHMHISYEFYTEMEEYDDPDIVEQLAQKGSEKFDKQKFIRSKQLEISELKSEQETILKITAQFASFLKENAITAFNDDLELYLEQQINEEQEKASQGSKPAKVTLATLKQDLQKYIAQRKSFDDALKRGNSACRLEDFNTLVKELYNLKRNGKEIERLMSELTSIQNKNATPSLNSVKTSISANVSGGIVDSVVGSLAKVWKNIW